MSKVYLLGAGPGDPGLLTLKAKDVLSKADVVVYDALANEEFLQYARKDAECIYVGKIADQHALKQHEINALLVRKAKEGKIVARLKGGDPYIFGRGGEEAMELLEANVAFEEIPGISSTIAAPAYAGIPLTHRQYASSVTIITGHETPDKEASVLDWQALARSASTLVFVMGMKNLSNIVENLLNAGMPATTPAALVYRGTTSRQRSLVATLASLPEQAQKERFTNPSVIIVGEVCALHEHLNWFEKRPLFGKRLVVTRAREQASGLASSLLSLGADVLQFPTIRIEDNKDSLSLRAAVSSLADYAWLIFTSVNGVRVFWDYLAQAGLDARALSANKIAAIGPATAEALAVRGIQADFIPEKFVAESVVEGLLKQGDLAGKKVLLPRALEARDVLPKALRAAGCTVQVEACYTTVPEEKHKQSVLERIQAGDIDCITFGSSSTVKNFFSFVDPSLIKAQDHIVFAAIGPITAKTLQDYGFEATIMPQDYTIPALVKEIVTYYNPSC